MTIPTTIQLKPAHRRDVSALVAQRQRYEAQSAALLAKARDCDERGALIVRAVLASEGFDPDVLLGGGWTATVSDSVTQIDLVAPPERK